MRDDEPMPDFLPDLESAVAYGEPDEEDLKIEAELMERPGVEAVSLVGDEWLVYMNDQAPIADLPRQIGDRLVRIELVD